MLTVRQLVNRTFAALRERPVLALPVLAADLIGFAAMHLQHALHQPLFDLFLNSNRSVLSTTHGAFVLTPENATRAALLTFPLVWGCYFLNILLYAAALLATAILLDSDCGHKPGPRNIWSVLASNKRRLLVLSCFALVTLILQIPLGYMLFWVTNKVPSFNPMQGRNLGYAIAFIVELVAVAILTRPALALLGEPRPDNRNVQLGRVFGWMALIAQFAILLSIEHLFPPSFFDQKTMLDLLVREALTSLLGCLPYIPLFIGFATISRASREHLGTEGQPKISFC